MRRVPILRNRRSASHSFSASLSWAPSVVTIVLHLFRQDTCRLSRDRRHQRRDVRVHLCLRPDLGRLQLEAELPLVQGSPARARPPRWGPYPPRQVSPAAVLIAAARPSSLVWRLEGISSTGHSEVPTHDAAGAGESCYRKSQSWQLVVEVPAKV